MCDELFFLELVGLVDGGVLAVGALDGGEGDITGEGIIFETPAVLPPFLKEVRNLTLALLAIILATTSSKVAAEGMMQLALLDSTDLSDLLDDIFLLAADLR